MSEILKETAPGKERHLPINGLPGNLGKPGWINFKRKEEAAHPFWVIVGKEISDHVGSWRFIILLAIISLTCIGSLYTSLSNMKEAVRADDPDNAFFFLKIFTATDGALPPFFALISMLGPLLGIGLGFDAINSEQNKGSLSRVMAQPIHRDNLITAKFTAALIVISAMFFALSFLVMGSGLLAIGIPPTPDEFMRVIFFTLLSIFYVGFWLSLSILFSVRFQQAATSALSAIAVWLFFSVFYFMLINLIAHATAPHEMAAPWKIIGHHKFISFIQALSPSQLFSDATTTLLSPSVRTLGLLTPDKLYGAIPGPLPLGQSLLIVWPQWTGLIAATVVCFVLSYVSFMRREIRSR